MRKILVMSFAGLLLCGVSIAQRSTANMGRNDRSSAQIASAQITNGPVAEYIADSSCTVGWSTSIPGNMSLRYGTDRSKMTQTADAVENKDGRNHHVELSGLTPNTRYFFQVLRNGQTVGNVGTFQTVQPGGEPVKSNAIIPR